MNKKLNIIISLIIAIIATVSVFFAKDLIYNYYHPVISSSDINTDEDDIFNSFENDTSDKYSYKTLADNYYKIKSLYLSIETKTVVTENGKVMDSKNDKQEFKYAKTYKLMVKSNERSLYCDGKNVTNYIPQAKTYMTEPISEDFFSAMVNGSPAINTIGLLIGIDYSDRIKNFKNTGLDFVGTRQCNLIEITLDGQGQVPDFIQKLWIEESTGLIIKNVYEIKRIVPDKNGKNTTLVMTVTNTTTDYRLNEPIKDSEFKFVPQTDDVKYDPKKDAALMEQMRNTPIEGNITQMQNPSPEVSAPSQENIKPEKYSPLDKQIYNFTAGRFKPSINRGKKQIIVFWAFGMGEDIMHSVQLFANTNKNQYEIVTINVNNQSKGLKEHVNDGKYSVPVYYLNEKDTETTVKKLQLISLPAIYFVDEIGVVRSILYGNSAPAQIQAVAMEKLNRDTDIQEKKEETKPNLSTDSPITNEIKPDINEEEPEVEISANKEEAK